MPVAWSDAALGRIFVGAAQQTSYFTTFGSAENPIIESGAWEHLDAFYQVIRSTGGNAVPAAVSGGGLGPGNPPYDDCYARKTGVWSADHEIVSTIYMGTATSGETEHLLRLSNSSSLVTAYECMINIDGTDCAIVQWTAHNGFTVLNSAGGTMTPPSGGLANGDKTRSRIQGTLISMWYARAATPTTWVSVGTYNTSGDAGRLTSGNPGLGFFKRGSGVTDAGNLDFGAQDLTITGL